MQKMHVTARDSVGVVRVGASVSVFNTGTFTLSSLFEDDETTPLANPLTSDSAGRVTFKVADGEYDVQISGTGFTTTSYTKVQVMDKDSKASASHSHVASDLGAGGDSEKFYRGDSSWQYVATSGAVTGLVGSRTAAGVYTLTADQLITRKANESAWRLFHNPGALTVDINDAQSAAEAGKRDQSANFGANTHIRIFVISGPLVGPLLIASLATRLAGPTLPTGYDSWGYVVTLVVDAAGTDFVVCRVAGSWVHFEGAGILQVLTAGNATAETAVATAGVPSDSLETELEISALATAVSQAGALKIRVTAGVEFKNYKTQTTAPGTLLDHLRIAQIGQNFFYLRQSALVTDIWVVGYRCPNGA